MISQKCPVCHSKRIRRGYRPTPFWSKLLLRYNLLCDNCNWEFIGFAAPGFISPQTKSSKQRKDQENVNIVKNEMQKSGEVPSKSGKSRTRTKKKVRIRI